MIRLTGRYLSATCRRSRMMPHGGKAGAGVKQMSLLMSSSVTGVVLFGLAACLPSSRIGAFEGADGARVEKAPLQTFATPRRRCRQVSKVSVQATPRPESRP
jgi:hypothetical protein